MVVTSGKTGKIIVTIPFFISGERLLQLLSHFYQHRQEKTRLFTDLEVLTLPTLHEWKE